MLALALACASGSAATPAHAHAQASAPPAGYSELIDDALREYESLHFEEARALFARAHALYPNARTLRGLGMVEFELRDYAESAALLQQALDARERPLAGALRESTLGLLARARGFVGELTVTVTPRDALLRVDGGAVVLEPGKPIALNVGDHVVEARAQGYAGERRKVVVRGGEQHQLAIELMPEPANASSGDRAAASATAPGDARGSGPGPWPWVVAGAGGALMIGGGVLLAIAQGDISQVEDAKKGTEWSESADAYDASPLESGLGFALLGVGAAGVVGGLIWELGADHDGARAGTIRVALGPRRVALLGSF